MKTKTITVKNNQIALVMQARKLFKVFTPGTYALREMNETSEIITIETDKLYTDGWQAGLLAKHRQALLPYIASYSLQHNEIGLLYVDNMMSRILKPGQPCFIGKSMENIRLERVPVREEIDIDPDVLWLVYQAGMNGAGKEKQQRMHCPDGGLDLLEARVSFYI
ncbi:hypothetical protein VA7868_03627 [Vibrio aerogenes CECT 7868]|uniref:Uncharacterized protein n=1 Tax=Vibrio aerogenes CECT 7868 TaxID=1216006 RepID=A0A1M6AP29_9VIBR|nr:hypothetical protein [Vibrio aerogenes]SHI38191.1 hypothetical protein VA7868_03627 [Vibrio aerogenes CECT 7868]